jgi:hypothetical protein
MLRSDHLHIQCPGVERGRGALCEEWRRREEGVSEVEGEMLCGAVRDMRLRFVMYCYGGASREICHLPSRRLRP